MYVLANSKAGNDVALRTETCDAKHRKVLARRKTYEQAKWIVTGG